MQTVKSSSHVAPETATAESPQDANKTWTAETLLEAALALVESKSIREWVRAQKDVWIRLAIPAVLKSSRTDKAEALALWIVSEAIGL